MADWGDKKLTDGVRCDAAAGGRVGRPARRRATRRGRLVSKGVVLKGEVNSVGQRHENAVEGRRWDRYAQGGHGATEHVHRIRHSASSSGAGGGGGARGQGLFAAKPHTTHGPKSGRGEALACREQD